MGRASSLTVTWVGHSTVLVELDGTRFLTDPLLRMRVAHLRRLQPVDAKALGGVDAVLVSHQHWDHLDVPSLRRLDPSVPVVAPRGAEPVLRRARRERVLTVGVGDEVELGGVAVRATPAEHAGGAAFARARLSATSSGARCPSTSQGTPISSPEWATWARRPRARPVWGWGPTLGEGHLDPARAATAVSLLRARVAVPIHWGTYYPLHARRGAYLTDPPLEFRRAAAAAAPETRVEILQPGESLELFTGAPVR